MIRLSRSLALLVVLFAGLLIGPVWAEDLASDQNKALERDAEELLFKTSTSEGAPRGAQSLANTFRRYLLAGNNKKVLALFSAEDQEYYHDSILSMKKKDLQTQGLYFRKAQCSSASDQSATYAYRPSVKFKTGTLYMKFDGKKWWLTSWYQCRKFAK